MSAFGDHTPKQEIYDAIVGVINEHGLGQKDVIKILAEIIVYLINYSD